MVMESAPLGRLLIVHTNMTAMTGERRVDDIRDSDFQPFAVNIMVLGTAQGGVDDGPFFEPAGTYHFHDLARPSLHGSTASLTYSLVLPRDVARAWFAPIEDLHGLVVAGDMALALTDLTKAVWRLLPGLAPEVAERFERALLELLTAGIEVSRPGAPGRAAVGDPLRAAAIEVIDQKLGLERATTSEICRVLNVRVDQLSAAFRNDGGMKAYLLERRLNEARTALTEPIALRRAELIGNIAHRLGFSDAAHLSRAFRHRFGLSPREYRSSKARGPLKAKLKA